MQISIVIPTRNRCEFLRYCLRTCLLAPDPGLEVVVSDNNSRDATREEVAAITDPRLRYVSPGADLSMRQNFEFALSHATGDYVVFIGDDDGILPNGLATLRGLIGRYRPDAVIWRHLTYIWPHRNPTPRDGVLKFRCRDFCGPLYTLDPMARFEDFCKARRTNYREGVNIYHGCVSRSVIERVKAVGGGEYFQGQNPDMNTAMSNLTAARSVLWMRNPVSIAGAGEKSNGSAMRKTQAASTSDQKSITRGFVSLAGSDPVATEVDLRVRSILPYTYANLDRVNRMHLGGRGLIDHAAWRQAIIRELRACSAEHRAWDLIEALFQQIDPAYTPQGLAEKEERGKAPPTTTASPPGPTKTKKAGPVASAHLLNVATAADWVQEVTGRPYRPTRVVPLALLKQLAKSVAMHQKMRTANKRPPGAPPPPAS